MGIRGGVATTASLTAFVLLSMSLFAVRDDSREADRRAAFRLPGPHSWGHSCRPFQICPPVQTTVCGMPPCGAGNLACGRLSAGWTRWKASPQPG